MITSDKQLPTLVQGHETTEGVAVLIKLTRITSEAKINALHAHLVDGLPARHAYWRYQVAQQHFSDALARLNRAADFAMKYTDIKNNTS